MPSVREKLETINFLSYLAGVKHPCKELLIIVDRPHGSHKLINSVPANLYQVVAGERKNFQPMSAGVTGRGARSMIIYI